jgi:hypothetical protein
MPYMPDLSAQRRSMNELSFLVGKWKGEARLLRAPGEVVELIQIEKAHYKLDGLLLVIEGIGRRQADGSTVLQALGIISCDDETGEYRMRAYNDGRWLETQVRLIEGEKGITWGFSMGEFRTQSRLLINEQGEWTELTELTIGSQAARKMMELVVRPERTKG